MAKVVTTLADAKAQFDCVRKAARDADRLSGAFIDRIAADVLMAAKGASPERAATMLVRMAVALEVLAERGWPEKIAGMPNKRPSSPRAAAEAAFG
jgi:hypothetical protein